MTLKLNPFLTDLRCHWLGRLAKPTYPVNLRRTTFLISLAAAAAALGSFELIVCGIGCAIGVLSFMYGEDGLPLGIAGDGEVRDCGDTGPFCVVIAAVEDVLDVIPITATIAL